MGPLEILFIAIVIIFILISLARGYLKELGVTTMIFVALFIITEFGVKYLPTTPGTNLRPLQCYLDHPSRAALDCNHIKSFAHFGRLRHVMPVLITSPFVALRRRDLPGS